MIRIWAMLVATLATTSVLPAREWTDATGGYTLEGELLGFNDDYVVVQRGDKELGMFSIKELSEADQAYLKSEAAQEINQKNLGAMQTWKTASGRTLTGRIVGYGRRDLTIQRRHGRTYANDRRLTNLPAFYRELLPEIIEHFDGVTIPNERALQNWLRNLRNHPRTFPLEGVVMESEEGDEFLVPFFVFTPDDRRLLQSGWASWLAVGGDADLLSSHAFRLEALMAAKVQNQEIQRQIALVDLNLQAIRAGLTSAWEVTLYPEPGNWHPPRWVVALGRNSAQATNAALQNHPGFVAGPVRRVSR